MRRNAFLALEHWKNDKYRQPLIILGARQVGKTWLMQEFGRKSFKNTAYLSFDNNQKLKAAFEETIMPEDLLPVLQAESGERIDESTLIIFDEIQEVPRALTSLKYFYENLPEYHIIAAGSTLGVTLHSGDIGTQFPVGKVEFMNLHPFSFIEFLEAIGEENLAELINYDNISSAQIFHEKYMTLLKQYFLVGGMPQVVQSYVDDRDFKTVRKLQHRILKSYDYDFSKYTNSEYSAKLRMLWNSIPAQLSKENKKFIFGAVKSGARARDFESAITWLMDCSMINKVGHITKPASPLKSYENFGSFKLFVHDIGLLCAMTNINPKIIVDNTGIFEEFKGSLTEQYVCQELLATNDFNLFYWSRGEERAKAELDFITENAYGDVVPIEVKGGLSLTAKSMGVYISKYEPKLAIRTSPATFKTNPNNLIDLPLYMISIINQL
jgi:predicted AAA+ superfamily ATPase